MGKTMNSEEIRLELINDMGEDLGTVFYHLRNRLLDCFFLWQDYKTLYFDKKERVEILNNAAAQFFGRIQKILQDKVVLDLCKLSDPAGIKKNGEELYNISYNRVMELVTESLHEEMAEVNDNLNSAISELKHHRHKRIGHNDFKTAESIRKSELKGITVEAIDKVFGLMQDAFNIIINHYQNATTPFHYLESHPSAKGLLYVLHDGLEARKERQERFINGNYTEQDVKRRTLQL